MAYEILPEYDRVEIVTPFFTSNCSTGTDFGHCPPRFSLAQAEDLQEDLSSHNEE